MKFSRLLLPLFCVAALLFAQQAGAVHALTHAVERQQDKQAPNSPACEKCEHYAQLGNALSVNALDFKLPPVFDEAIQYLSTGFRSTRAPAATARAPPLLLKKTV
jgi:hypothetical protein